MNKARPHINQLYRAAVILFSCLLLCALPQPVKAQYIANGNATQDNCHCYTLTQAVNGQRGSVWNSNKINLNLPFDYGFDIFFGCQDVNGADGIAFILQPISTSIGSSGSGLGFSGITPSVGVLLDTYQNSTEGDPTFDHISINRNGDVVHGTPNNLTGPFQIINGMDNIEDCQWHVLRVVWNPATFTLSAYIDGNLRVQHTVDMVNTIFGGDPNVFWGFSASTGGLNNEQKFCTRLDAGFVTSVPDDAICLGQSITFNPQVDAFVPVIGYFWDFGDGTTANVLNPPPHTYATTGPKIVRFAITGIDGCTSDTAIATVHVGAKPVAGFSFNDTCQGKPVLLNSNSSCAYGTVDTWTWLANGLPAGNTPSVSLSSLPIGNSNTIKLVVETNYGCVSDTVTQTVRIFPAPDVEALAADACVNTPVLLSGVQLDALTTITQWQWRLSDNRTAATQNANFSFGTAGNYTASLYAVSGNGCHSDTATVNFDIEEAQARAGNDTLVVQNQPFTLNGSGNGQFSWTPAAVLSNAGIPNPSGVISDDQTFVLTVTTPAGCTATDEVTVKVFKGSQIYVPTGFTPNRDGRNDVLKPLYLGIKELKYFVVYNRWGQEVFRTSNLQEGWDGRFQLKDQPAGSYVWMLQATGLLGTEFRQKGTVLIIR